MNTLSRIAAVVTGAALVITTLAGTASAATPATVSGLTPSHVAGVHDGSCSPSFTKGWTSVDLVITNNTAFPINYEPGLSGPSTGHWNQRPAATLEPGQCEVVNAYAAADVKIFNLNVVYSTPWGDYFPFEGTANSTTWTTNSNVFVGIPQYHSNNYYWSGTIDPRYQITASGWTGMLHTHYNLSLT